MRPVSQGLFPGLQHPLPIERKVEYNRVLFPNKTNLTTFLITIFFTHYYFRHTSRYRQCFAEVLTTVEVCAHATTFEN